MACFYSDTMVSTEVYPRVSGFYPVDDKDRKKRDKELVLTCIKNKKLDWIKSLSKRISDACIMPLFLFVPQQDIKPIIWGTQKEWKGYNFYKIKE